MRTYDLLWGYRVAAVLQYKLGDDAMDDSLKLQTYLDGLSKEKLLRLTVKIEQLEDPEFNEFLGVLKKLFT